MSHPRRVARTAAAKGTDLAANARLFALLYMAVSDSSVASAN
jgi:hypothetical protein